MLYKEIEVESALTKLKRKIPYGWDLNIYRGCQHACQYCFAMYSHDYLNSPDFFNEVFVKTNIVDVLEKQLRAGSWKAQVINLGGVTDSYQPAEARYKIMPEILRLMIKYKNPVIISSKSKLVLRDFELIEQLAGVTYVNIAQTITTLDEEIRTRVEPGSSSTADRFEVLREFRKTTVVTGVHVMPIIPFLTDSQVNLEGIFSMARDCRADYLLPGTLYLRGATRSHFFEFIKKEFPQLLECFKGLYKTGGAAKDYKTTLYNMINGLRKKYGVSGSYMKPMREKFALYKGEGDYKQTPLF